MKYIITGGSCTGKSALHKELTKRGHNVVEEAARIVIARERAKGGQILPWIDLLAFQYAVLEEQENLESTVVGDVFLDRSYVDSLAYARSANIDIEQYVLDKVRNAGYSTVFFLDRLGFYENDSERLETEEESLKIHDLLYKVYDELGFDIIKVPPISIKERADYVLERLERDSQYEIEGKFRIPHSSIESRLRNFRVDQISEGGEHNVVFSFGNQMLRLRNNGRFILTVKGPVENHEFKKRLESEIEISPKMYLQLMDFLPNPIQYSKQRRILSPFGDPSCTICLDTLTSGEYVEIEGTENQVRLWKDRLGITGDCLKKSYVELENAK